MKWIVIPVLVLAGMLILIVVIGALLPKQHVASRSASLNASPEATWNLISGPPTWRPEIKSYEELPPQNGHRMGRNRSPWAGNYLRDHRIFAAQAAGFENCRSQTAFRWHVDL